MIVSGSACRRADRRRVGVAAVRRRRIVDVGRHADHARRARPAPPAPRRRRDRSTRSGAGGPGSDPLVAGRAAQRLRESAGGRPAVREARARRPARSRARPDSAAAAASGAPTHAPSAHLRLRSVIADRRSPRVSTRRSRAAAARSPCRRRTPTSRSARPRRVASKTWMRGIDALGVGHQQAAVADRRLPEIERRRGPERRRPAGDEVEDVQVVGDAGAEAAHRRRERARRAAGRRQRHHPGERDGRRRERDARDDRAPASPASSTCRPRRCPIPAPARPNRTIPRTRPAPSSSPGGSRALRSSSARRAAGSARPDRSRDR